MAGKRSEDRPKKTKEEESELDLRSVKDQMKEMEERHQRELSALNDAVKKLEQSLGQKIKEIEDNVNEQMEKTDKLRGELDKRIDEVANIQIGSGIEFDDKVQKVQNDTESKIDSIWIKNQDRLDKIEHLVDELASKVEVCRIKMEEYDNQWPAVSDSGSSDNVKFNLVQYKNGKRDKRGVTKEVSEGANVNSSGTSTTRVSMAQKLRSKERKVVVLGDSLAVGMGYKLKEQCGGIIDVKAHGGAKLEKVADTVQKLGTDDNRQIVVVAGANNMKEDTAADMLGSFEKIICEGNKAKSNIVIVGLVKRYDLEREYECKRIVVNARLKQMCKDKQVSYLEYEPERSRLHRDGLHMNFRGQDELGRRVFPFVKNFLA